MSHTEHNTPLDIIQQGREVKVRFFHGNKLWSSYAAYIADAEGNMYFPVNEGSSMHRGIKKNAFVSAIIELIDSETGDVTAQTEVNGTLELLTENRQHWNDRFVAKYNQSMTKEIAEMMLHKQWYTIKVINL